MSNWLARLELLLLQPYSFVVDHPDALGGCFFSAGWAGALGDCELHTVSRAELKAAAIAERRSPRLNIYRRSSTPVAMHSVSIVWHDEARLR